jgi:hypothetical protein
MKKIIASIGIAILFLAALGFALISFGGLKTNDMDGFRDMIDSLWGWAE